MGNVIDMGISGTHIIPEPATEFFFYALLMVLTMGIFIFLGELPPCSSAIWFPSGSVIVVVSFSDPIHLRRGGSRRGAANAGQGADPRRGHDLLAAPPFLRRGNTREPQNFAALTLHY